MRKVFPFLFALAIVVMGSCGTSATHTEAVQDKIISDSTLQLLGIDTVRLRRIDDEVRLTGEVSFDENRVVKIYPFSSGQVLQVNVSIGDYVKAGQPLATIRSADIAGTYADLSAAGNDVAIAKRAMDNAEHLFRNGIASEKEWVEAKENYQKALANAGKIRDQLQINGGGRTSANGSYVISAPRSGYVVEKLINPGNFIRGDNTSNVFTIGDISDVWIWANVFETDVSKVREGYTAQVTTIAYPDTVFEGRVDKVNEVLDPQTKVMKVRIVLRNPKGLLKPEMFANILVYNRESKQALAVPSTALISENGRNYVVLFNGQNDVRVQEVQVEKTTGSMSFLQSGVSEGQRIITRNQILVYAKIKEK